MPYSDLYADADFYMSLNNNYNWTTTATVLSANGGFTGTPVYVADSPAGVESTHSLKINGYGATNAAKPPRPTFNNYPQRTQTTGTFGTGKTFTCWLKFVPLVTLVDGTTNLGGSPLDLWLNTPTTNSSTNDFARINFNTYQQEGGQGNMTTQWNMGEITISTSTSGGTSIFGTKKFDFNKWYHIAFVVKDYAPSTLEKAVYVNGQCIQYTITANKSTQGPYWCISDSPVRSDTIFTTEAGNTVLDKYIAHYAKWNRALTKEEIRAQAWYGHTNEDYDSVVLGDNPTYYASLNNPTKAVDNAIYGATSWGPLNDEIVGFTVNEQGPANLKAWKMTPQPSSIDAITDTTDPEMMSGLTSLFTSGEYSVEFWLKMAGKPSQPRSFIGTNQITANLPNGYIDIQMDSNGIPRVTQSYKSTATTYLSGSVTGTSLPAVTDAQLNMHPGTGVNNFCDDKWHHIVYTFSKSDSWASAGSFTGNVYMDGMRINTRNFTNTSGWLDGTTPQTYLRLGSALNAPSVTNGTASIAAIAFYPRRITETEIEHHYLAGTDYLENTRTVRYFNGTSWINSSAQKVWNGTAWVDWNAKRYDGSNWVVV
jgi:hypothetical protein